MYIKSELGTRGINCVGFIFLFIPGYFGWGDVEREREREMECILFLHFEILQSCFSSLHVWSFLVLFFFSLF